MLKKFSMTIALASLLLAACASIKGSYDVPAKHPEKLASARPLCSGCHEASADGLVYRNFDHTPAFGRGDHGFMARQQEGVCAMCHAQSYCGDCHAVRVELKPSERRFSETYRQMPHRGDYRTRHQMDGRLDPASCFNCHGNPKVGKACAACHG